MISMDNVSKWYGQFQVLTDCTTKVEKWRGDRRVRAVGLGQVDAHQVRQRAGTLSRRARSR